jgi:hypothetical protein
MEALDLSSASRVTESSGSVLTGITAELFRAAATLDPKNYKI